ncbi:MAG TPA: hypothetical protein VGN86_16900 [Pyrinomonadaceae bacterium]|nr:hypothetical protein [Pyrinomonadaceae bacterium]
MTSLGSDSSNTASAAITTSQGKVPVCDLLTSKELQPVQGEALKETKPSARSEGGFLISQCFYSMTTFSNSISLLVAQRGETAGAREPKDFWKENFSRVDEEEREKTRKKESEREKEREQDKAKDKDKGKGEPAAIAERVEDERGAPPVKISGIGDDAYWTGNRVGGALYVLKDNTYFRISVGGAGDQQTKIKRATALAQIILKRL